MLALCHAGLVSCCHGVAEGCCGSYAREDTHYLLYIYDLLRNELVRPAPARCPQHDALQER